MKMLPSGHTPVMVRAPAEAPPSRQAATATAIGSSGQERCVERNMNGSRRLLPDFHDTSKKHANTIR
jgi:hypothetical protein